MQKVPKLREQLHKIKNIIQNAPAASNIHTLQKLIEDSEDKMMVMIMGEFKAGKSTFLNALLGEELLVSDVTPATAINTIIKYGDAHQLHAVFKNGTKETLNQNHIKVISAEGDPVGAHLRKKIDYLILEAPKEILKNITFIDSPGLNSIHEEHTYETKRFIKRADDVLWLFRYGIVGRSTEADSIELVIEEGIMPLGIVNAIDLHYEQSDEDIEEYLQEERGKHQLYLRDLIGVSAQDALESMIENDQEKWEWSNFDELHTILNEIANDSTKKENRTLMKSKAFFEELLTETISLLEKDQYAEQLQSFQKFIEENQKELYNKKDNTVTEIIKLEQDMKKWDLFSEKVTSLSKLQSILKKPQLYRKNSNLLATLTGLSNTITSFETKSKEYADYYLNVKDMHKEAVGSGMTRVKQLFTKKQKLTKVNRAISLLDSKRDSSLKLVGQIKQQQDQLQETLAKALSEIQRDIKNQRTGLYKQAKEQKNNLFAVIEKEHQSQNKALDFFQKYNYLDELQQLIKTELLPMFESWKKMDGISLDVIGDIKAILNNLLQIKTATKFIAIYYQNQTELQKDTIEISFSPELPYNVSDQVPLHICAEYKPTVLDAPHFNTMYLRPYTMTAITGLLLFLLYQNNFQSKLFVVKDKVIAWISGTPSDEVFNPAEEGPTYIGTVEILVDSLNIRSGPSTDFEEVGVATLGEQFDVLEESEGWLKIGEGEWISGNPKYTSYAPYNDALKESNEETEQQAPSFTLNDFSNDEITSFITNFTYDNFQSGFQLDRAASFANPEVYNAFLKYSNNREAGCYVENGAEDFRLIELEALQRISEQEAVYRVEEIFYDSLSDWASKVIYTNEYTVSVSREGELVISSFLQEDKGIYGFDWCNYPRE